MVKGEGTKKGRDGRVKEWGRRADQEDAKGGSKEGNFQRMSKK